MTTLSFTTYVDAPTDEVSTLISSVTAPVPTGAVVEVMPFVDRTKVVVHMPWLADNESHRSDSTLAATRFVRALDIATLAA